MANHIKKQQKLGKETLALAVKIHNYNKDIISEKDLLSFNNKVEVLKNALSIKPVDVGLIAQAVDSLEPLFKKYGGSFYPKRFAYENVEMLLVAAILVIGIRTFFFQPFVIPTNSMYPSFNGMTYNIYNEEKPPNILTRSFNYLVKGVSRKRIESPENGSLKVPIQIGIVSKGVGLFEVQTVIPSKRSRGFSRIMLPTQKDTYNLRVGSEEMEVSVPAEFRFQEVITEKFFSKKSAIEHVEEQFGNVRQFVGNGLSKVIWVEVESSFKKGDIMVDFDIISGDALFVDRMSYHFVSPKVGDSIVFKTSKIKSLVAEPEKYYIKRLVGVGGDVLKIKEPILYRNGKPINGVAPFDKNNKALGDYKGYKAEEALAEGKEVEILPNHYYAMGDNSRNSADSRYWGQVPDTEVLGRALFIYYPFSSHWGLTE